MVQTESGAAMFNVTVVTNGLTKQLQTCTVVIRRKTTPSDARENDSAANRNTNATALRTIIESPSYMPKYTQEYMRTYLNTYKHL